MSDASETSEISEISETSDTSGILALSAGYDVSDLSEKTENSLAQAINQAIDRAALTEYILFCIQHIGRRRRFTCA
jgi:hypothetical protein